MNEASNPYQKYQDSAPRGYPWPMDKPIEEIEKVWSSHHQPWITSYLLDRLKIAEEERDSLREWAAPFKKGWE